MVPFGLDRLFLSEKLKEPDYIIETERLKLRKFNSGDAEFIYRLLNSPGWLKYIGKRNINSDKDAENYINNVLCEGYRRCGYGFYPAASIGAMIDLSGKLRFLAGGSLIFGSRERFILNGGVAYGAISHLSSDYATDRSYPTDNLPDSPPVYDKFCWGGYLGMTFSFGFEKKPTEIGSAVAE